MNNVLVVSIESENVRTEEIYFTNKKNTECLSFKRDKWFLKNLNLKDVFFLSFNISITWKGFESVVKRLQKVNPTIYEAFFLCDRDSKSYSDKQIEEKYSQLSKIIEKALMVNKQNIYYLKYKNRGQKFEDFLASHFLVKNIYKGYKKTDKNLYLKTMGRKGKNLETLRKNLVSIDYANNFEKLFVIRPPIEPS